MDRAQFLSLGLPLILFCSGLFFLFTSPPPPKPSVVAGPATIQFPSDVKPSTTTIGEGVGLGNTVNINFCSSCCRRMGKLVRMADRVLSRGKAVTMKNMLEIAFPGTEIGVIGLLVAGEQIFPRLGFVAPPPWYYNLRANELTIGSTWLIGNALQSFLHSTGAFEVYFNGELVFSKLKESRFPGEIELKDLIGNKMANSRLANGVPGLSL